MIVINFQFSCSLMMVDDVIDKSTIRRGKKCWYLNEGVGLNVLYDAILIYSTINDTLKQKFFNSQRYGNMTRIILRTSRELLLGQKCEVETSNSKEPIYKKFTSHKHYILSKYKTGSSINCAFAMALNLANVTNEKVLRLSRHVLDNVGYLTQIQVSEQSE